MNPRRRKALRREPQPFVRLGFSLFVVWPIELRERRAGDAAGFEPSVAVCFTAGAVRPSALFRDVEWARGIDRRLTAMRFADADELDEGAVHYASVTERETGLEPAKPSAWEADALPTELLPRFVRIVFVLGEPARVSQIASGLPAVIVRASNFALSDLRGQPDEILLPDER